MNSGTVIRQRIKIVEIEIEIRKQMKCSLRDFLNVCFCTHRY
jgi:hypothetical protein